DVGVIDGDRESGEVLGAVGGAVVKLHAAGLHALLDAFIELQVRAVLPQWQHIALEREDKVPQRNSGGPELIGPALKAVVGRGASRCAVRAGLKRKWKREHIGEASIEELDGRVGQVRFENSRERCGVATGQLRA